MPSYENPDHSGRLIVLPYLENAFDEVFLSHAPPGCEAVTLIGSDGTLFQRAEPGQQTALKSAYNFPFLFKRDGAPWLEANSYIYETIKYKHPQDRPGDDAHRRASILLDFDVFCDNKDIDWTDFSGKRYSLRPYGLYFNHLKNLSGISSSAINSKMRVLYDFYAHAAKHWIVLDIERVDTVTPYKKHIRTERGSAVVEGKKRGMTMRTSSISSVPEGMVRDDGEDLRPLSNSQYTKLNSVILESDFTVQDRLIIDLAAQTGARKQTILTLRLKHLSSFKPENLLRNKTYRLHVGPGTGADTKNQKNQVIYVPEELAKRLVIWSSCPTAKKRQGNFLKIYSTNHPELPLPAREDIYLFLSDQSNCYYMARNDLRYPIAKTIPRGQVTASLKRRLALLMGNELPMDFTFHWLRATFAYQTWQKLQTGIQKGYLKPGEDISIIQSLLCHNYRETTENYLKLFKMINETLEAQISYESWLFDPSLDDALDNGI